MPDQPMGEPDEVDYPIPGNDSPPSMLDAYYFELCESTRAVLEEFGYEHPEHYKLKTVDDVVERGTMEEICDIVHKLLHAPDSIADDNLKAQAQEVLDEWGKLAKFVVDHYAQASRLAARQSARNFAQTRVPPRS